MTPPVPRIQLGRTDMWISRIGVGAWAMGGIGWETSWGEQDDADSVAAIRSAVEAGVNWIDTAPIYGVGHSEEVVGRAILGLGDAERPYVFTKAGLIWDPSDPMRAPAKVGAPASIKAEVDASLRRLGVERIDLYQMHWPPTDGTSIEAYWQAFLDLRQSGKVRAVGLSNHAVPQLEAAEALGHIDSLQPKFNLIHRDAADVLAWCAEHDTGVIAYSPMASGLLTGTFDAQRAAALQAEDWRSRSADFTGDRLTRSLALVDALRPVAARNGVSVAAVAVAWTLAFRGVTGAIIGLRRPEQVDAWLAAASLELGDDDLDEIAAAIEDTGAGSGPTRPHSV